ncbi:MAG: hypothetical protein H0W04_02625, partial [Chthoniobacterales bacterium]|nr:hypothetical protein [Chthoniobacterales bacterium]
TEIADVILPHLRDRPLTLKRYPEGITGEHFYEKNAPKHAPAWVKTFPVPRSEGGGAINYVLCNDRATLIWATNLADIEKHVLLATAPGLHQPTSVVFDLDPGEPAGILDCGSVALHLKGLFDLWGLESFVKVSGSKGLHLSVPLNAGATYEITQPFAKAIAELGAHQLRGRVVSEMAKSIRAGKVLIDWSQNSDFKTTVCVYSMRAKSGEPFVSMPITWDELKRAVRRKDEKALSFTPAAAIKRIRKIGDLFAPVLTLEQQLPAVFTKALASGPAPKLSRWPRNTKRSDDERDKSLREYSAKRDFTQTAEPAAQIAKEAKRDGPRRFVIQKHAASHLHYDWRLEMQGVLRSWAVPKGPPTQLREARLAMHVEDHPLEYEKFEGTIPPGNYGAGTVMVWDYGVYEDITGNAAAAFWSGKMHIVMQGQKLQGEWILVKDKREPESNKWLLIKAGESMNPISAKSDDTSAVSRRSMAAIAKANDAQWESNRPAASVKIINRLTKERTTSSAPLPSPQPSPRGRGDSFSRGEKVRMRGPSPHESTPGSKRSPKTAQPKFVEPMQCKAVKKLPEDDNWTFEIKFDGYRCIAVKNEHAVALLSRNQNSLNSRFPNVVEALAALPGDFALDGEIVALDEQGRPSFQLLQNNVTRPLAVFFYVFDLLHRDGEDLQQRPIARRRELLNELLPEAADPLRLSPLLEASPGQVLDAVRSLGLEGVVGKRNGSVYEAGERSGAWIKHRTDRAQEFVIGGYVPGARGFDSLLVGVYDEKRFIFVAKVKDGFVPRLREEIFTKFKKLHTETCPFVNLPEKKGARRG